MQNANTCFHQHYFITTTTLKNSFSEKITIFLGE